MCNRIIVLSEGKIIEDGTHFELLSTKGKYHELYSMQAEFFIEQSLVKG